jgi:hypothetical protein
VNSYDGLEERSIRHGLNLVAQGLHRHDSREGRPHVFLTFFGYERQHDRDVVSLECCPRDRLPGRWRVRVSAPTAPTPNKMLEIMPRSQPGSRSAARLAEVVPQGRELGPSMLIHRGGGELRGEVEPEQRVENPADAA